MIDMSETDLFSIKFYNNTVNRNDFSDLQLQMTCLMNIPFSYTRIESFERTLHLHRS